MDKVIEPERAYDIYIITNLVIQKKYIGLTTTGVEQRWIEHRAYSKRGSDKGHPLYQDLLDYGVDSFTVTHIACCKNLSDLKVTERNLIAQEQTMTPNGYNLSSGGEGGFITSAKGVDYNGTYYQTHKTLAERYNVDYGVFMYRIKSNWSLSQALGDEPPPINDPNAIEVNLPVGTFNSISSAANHLKIDKDTVYSRLKHGKTIEQAFGFEPIHHALYRQIKIDGKTYASVRSAAQSYGISYTTVKDRLRGDRGVIWTIEQALEITSPPPRKPPPRWNDKKVYAFGNEYSSQASFARAHNVNPQMVIARLKKGYTPEEAVILPSLKGQSPEGIPNSKHKPIYLVGNDKVQYYSAAKMASDIGSSTSTIKTFLKNEWPIFGKLYSYSPKITEPNRKKLPRLCNCVIHLETNSIYSSTQDASKVLNRSPEGIQQHCAGKYRTQEFIYVCDKLNVKH